MIEGARPPRVGWSYHTAIPKKEVPPECMHYRARSAINAAVPFLVPTQKTNLVLLVSVILKKRTLCLSEFARAYPTPARWRVAAPKRDLLYRLKKPWRFTDNERIDALVGQTALVPHTVARLIRHHAALRRADTLPGLAYSRATQG